MSIKKVSTVQSKPVSTRHTGKPQTQAPADMWAKVRLPKDSDALIKKLHQGFDYKVFERISSVAGIDKQAIAHHVNISRATLNRRKKTEKFTTEESDRLYRLVGLLAASEELFGGDTAAAQRWVNKPVRGLGNKAPMEMLGTTPEYDQVLALIARLEHGVPP